MNRNSVEKNVSGCDRRLGVLLVASRLRTTAVISVIAPFIIFVVGSAALVRPLRRDPTKIELTDTVLYLNALAVAGRFTRSCR